MSTPPRQPLGQDRFDQALAAADIVVEAEDRDAIFKTAQWLDKGLDRLAKSFPDTPVAR